MMPLPDSQVSLLVPNNVDEKGKYNEIRSPVSFHKRKCRYSEKRVSTYISCHLFHKLVRCQHILRSTAADQLLQFLNNGAAES